MKKNILFFLSLFLIFLCAGCSEKPDNSLSGSAEQESEADNKQFTMKSISELQEEAKNLEDDYVNLDLSDTVISIPDVDEIADLVFPITYTLQEQKEKFEDNIRKYAGLDANTDLTPYMSIAYLDKKQNDRLVIPYDEATEEQLEQIQYLCYNDGKYSELLVFSNYMLEMSSYELPTSLTGDTKDYSGNAYGYRGIDLGTAVKTYYLPEDDISDVSYSLADGEVALKDAIAYAEKHVKEDYYFVGSELLDYHVYQVRVWQLNDSVYYYQFYLYPTYQGISLNKDMGLVAEEEVDLSGVVFGDRHTVSMFRSDQLGFIWSSCHSYEKVEPQESHSEFISLKDACSLLSDYISKKKEFSITSLELIYQTEFQYESQEKMEEGYIQSIYCHPVYHFYIANPGVSGYSYCYFDVDAITGEIITVQGW